MLVTGQVHGGLAQGIGQALWEEMHYDAGGELLTGTLNDYAVPKAHGFPIFETHHTTTTDADQPARRQGHRRGGHDRLDPGRRQRGDRRAVAVGHHPPRHPVHAGEGLAGDPGGGHGASHGGGLRRPSAKVIEGARVPRLQLHACWQAGSAAWVVHAQ